MYRERRTARSRFIWGIILLVCGAFALAVNLGLSRDVWEYWPVLLLAIGVVQMLWPGTARERLGGFTLIGVGIYGFVSMFEIFGLHFGTAWPILLVFLGIRIVLGGLFEHGRREQGSGSGQGGAP
jgi:hypothetical protein